MTLLEDWVDVVKRIVEFGKSVEIFFMRDKLDRDSPILIAFIQINLPGGFFIE